MNSLPDPPPPEHVTANACGVPTAWQEASRPEKKEQRRQEIRATARRLFDARGFDTVTVDDVAIEASVSLQTVYNHFATKEDLFLDGRTSWVDGPAQAGRARDAGVCPLMAVRIYLARATRDTVEFERMPAGRTFRQAIQSSPALSAREREFQGEAERRPSKALVAAWAEHPNFRGITRVPVTQRQRGCRPSLGDLPVGARALVERARPRLLT